jgi:hypothetical protein
VDSFKKVGRSLKYVLLGFFAALSIGLEAQTIITQSANVLFTGGTIDGTTIGATTPSTGAFTTLSASSTVSGSGFSTYLASPPAIGGSSAAAGSFTALSASSTVSGSGFSTYLASPPAIGGTAPAAISATTLSATGNVMMSGLTTSGTIANSICSDSSGHIISTSSSNCFASSSSGPSWVKTTVPYTSFTSAATTQTITLYTLAAGGVIQTAKVKQSTAFSGGSVSDVNVSIGYGGTNTAITPTWDVFSAVTATNYQLVASLFGASQTATNSITITANSTGGNLSTLTAGSVDVWLLVSVAI